MTDDDIARHNELATAQRNAAWNFLVYASQWFDRSGVREYDPDKERAHIAAKYPLKRRVKRENEWVTFPMAFYGQTQYRVEGRALVIRAHETAPIQVIGAGYIHPLHTAREAIKALLAQFDVADTIEDDPTWSDP